MSEPATENALVERKVDREIADTIAIGKGGINFSNAGEVMEYAKMMAASGSAVPKHLRGQPGACLGILDDAIRLGVNPYALARKSYFVNDLLAYEAAVFMALINTKAPLKTRPDIRFEGEGQEMRAIVTGKFLDGAVRDYKSPRIADISPKNSPLWKSDPGQQLSYYSLRGFARRWCPEVILGIHDVDEIREAAMTDITPKDEAAKPAPRSLEEFAAAAAAGHVLEQDVGITASRPHESAGPEGSSGPPPVSQPPTAAADFHKSVELGELKAQAIDKVLALAADLDLDEQERLESLDRVQPVYQDKLDAEFCRTLFATATKIAKGALKKDAAQRYLEGLR